MKHKNKILITILLSIGLLLVVGCGNNSNESNANGDTLPVDVENLIKNSKGLFLSQTYEHDNTLYILVSYGEKPTGGYTVEITDIEEKQDVIEVTVNFAEPGPDQMVTQAITYPYDLKSTDATDKEIVFNVEGCESYLPKLLGINVLEPIVAGKKGIMIFEPSPNAKILNHINFRGISNTFEGTVNYFLETEDGEKLLEGFTTGAMMDWGYFEDDIKIPSDAQGKLILRVFTYSAKDGSIQDEFTIPLIVE